MMHRLTRAAAAALAGALMLGAAGCGKGHNDASAFRFIDTEGWRYGDTLRFPLHTRDSAATGVLTLTLRHTNDYAYSNVYLAVTVADSLGARTDTVCLDMADSFGRWYGRGIGTDFQLTDTLAPDPLTLHRPAEVVIRHIMRTDRLKDIEQIGVSFTELPQNTDTRL